MTFGVIARRHSRQLVWVLPVNGKHCAAQMLRAVDTLDLCVFPWGSHQFLYFGLYHFRMQTQLERLSDIAAQDVDVLRLRRLKWLWFLMDRKDPLKKWWIIFLWFFKWWVSIYLRITGLVNEACKIWLKWIILHNKVVLTFGQLHPFPLCTFTF